VSSVQETINRARAAQKDWIDHMKRNGWHGCPVCKSNPIPKDKKICAICKHKLRQSGKAMPKVKEAGPKQPGLNFQSDKVVGLTAYKLKKEQTDGG
jgi:hypothetical protein